MSAKPRAACLPSKTATVQGRILIVDDHRSARESMADILRHAGYGVDTLSSAVEAIQYLGDKSVDLVVTDLQMPGMSGLEFIRELARRQHGAQIVMVTAHATVASAVDAMRYGAFDYIEKPFDADRLEQLAARATRANGSASCGSQLAACRRPLSNRSLSRCTRSLGSSGR